MLMPWNRGFKGSATATGGGNSDEEDEATGLKKTKGTERGT
jgi:hypothetical protein